MIQILRRKKKYKGKKYGIIRRNAPNCGLFSFFIVILGAINKCIEEELIPIIDMQTYKNPYLENEQVGKVNAWNFYFLQPMGINLNDISMSEVAIIDADRDIPESHRPNISMDFLTNPYAIQQWRDICYKYIKFQPEILDILEEKKKVILDNWDGKKLGILCRGTDYLNLKPSGHPVQPAIDIVIEKAKQVMKEKECKYIYLATEDEDIFQRFQLEFGSQLLVTESDRYSNTDNQYLSEVMEKQKTNKYENGLNYLINIYLLSNCECLLAGRVSGLLGALLLGKEYEYEYFWNYGYY